MPWRRAQMSSQPHATTGSEDDDLPGPRIFTSLLCFLWPGRNGQKVKDDDDSVVNASEMQQKALFHDISWTSR